MALTIHDLLLRQPLPQLALAAGREGLGHELRTLNSAELLYDETCFHAGELIFTTGYDMDDGEKYAALLPKLARRGISGIVLQIGRYQQRPPDYLTALCDQISLPLLTLPHTVAFPDILSALLPLLAPDRNPEADDRTLSAARGFFQQCIQEHRQVLFPDHPDHLVRLILLETVPDPAISPQVREKTFAQVRSFIQSACHFCMYLRLSEGRWAFIAAHTREDSPSMMYRLHLQFIALYQDCGVNYLLGNDYLAAPEQLDITLHHAAEGLHTLHRTGARRGVCTYESIRFIRMLSYLRRDNSSVFLENQALKVLLHYDKENHTQYMDTLRIYLSANCNLARTSKILFIHRNTLINRLERISAISGLRVEDYYARIHLSVALMFHDYFAS